jgi:biopolymer transport protein TolR
MAINVRNEGAKVNSNINVTPMVDVMLVMLIIFMVITPMLQHGVPVNMATVNSPQEMPDADKEDAVIVAVTRDSMVYLGTEKMTDLGNLGPKVRDLIDKKTDKRIYIRADSRAQYGRVTDVVDNVRSAGVDDVGLLTEQRKAQTNPPGTP